MRTNSRKLHDADGFSVWELGRDRLEETTRFVFSVYYAGIEETRRGRAEDDFAHMLAEDVAHAPSAFVVAALAPSGRMLGTGRLIERRALPLPMERHFGLDVDHLPEGIPFGCGGWNRVFEVARLATDTRAARAAGIADARIPTIADAVVLELLRRSAEPRNLWVAAMDVRALALFRRRGFCFLDAGRTVPSYLNSPTTPVVLPVDLCRFSMWAARRDRYEHYFGSASGAFPAPPTSAPAPASAPTAAPMSP